ncbi:apolipoprotein N-acyltransferase [Mycobacterium helveticum]|uniref:Apolipoprotein N-acyltransferase n=1 Tax=Mycobacterium helveticum TaxID=2592811 RepID=A0A557XMA9_9MYCO|nr:apolipoprotein N-acyltransferase [Mycobacterium helveticum]TVS87867.1 apolipoprotein N-acyltransferase [Mycobacterium helveticum]
MARRWFARNARPAAAGGTVPADEEPAAGPGADDTASEPAVPPEPPPAEDEPAGPRPAARLAATTRRAAVRLAAVALARLPAVRAALRPRLARLLLAVAGGLLLCASFPPRNWWWAAVVAAALLAWVLTHRATSPAGGFGYGFLFGLALYLPLLPWISALVGAMPWLVLAITCALFPGLFGLLAVVVRRLPGWPIWFAVLWSAQEWLKANYPFGGFPWGSVAFGQSDGPFLPLARLGGVALLSTAIMLVGFSAAAIAREIVAWWPRGGRPRTHGRGEADRPPAVVLPGVCICVVFFAAVAVWPQVRHAGTGAGGEPLVTVAVVQGNVPRLGLGFNAQRRAVLDNHVRETLRLAEDVRSGVAPQPQFVIWPEDSSDIDPLVNADAAQQIAKAATAIHAPILVGTVLGIPGRPPDDPAYTNTVIVWNPVTGPADRHDKEIVQPFGEYLPMPWLFRHLSGYAGLAGHMVPGRSSGVVHIGGVPLGVATCWEVIFDREPRDAVLHGAQLLAVPSNNATFNKTMSEQQLAFAKVRAVEHDRYVVVAGTTGVSAMIAPDGGELVRTDFFEPAYLDVQVRLKTKLTPATRWAPLLQWILVAVAGAVVLAGIRHNGWFPRPIRLRSRPVEPDDDAPPDEGGSDTSQDPPPDDGGDQVPPAEGGDSTPLHRSGRQPRYFGRHRGAQ